MLRQIALFLAAFSFAFLVLFTSVFKIASIKYAFSQAPTPAPVSLSKEKEIDINYELTYPGGILPDNFLWPVKALRDNAWVSLSLNPLKKSQIILLFSYKRLNLTHVYF